MEIVREKQKRTLKPLPQLMLHEYDMHDPALGGGIAELKGRYPDKGFVTNTGTKELVYILSGQGKILTPKNETALSAGDMVLIDKNEIYAWDGTMSLYMANAPKFDPAQHKQVPAP